MMKYIILQIKVGALVCKFPFVFPPELSHLEMTTAIKKITSISEGEVVSAGECQINYLCCYGGSKTLGVPFKVVDRSAIINNDFLRCMTLNEIDKIPKRIIDKIEEAIPKMIDHKKQQPVSK